MQTNNRDGDDSSKVETHSTNKCCDDVQEEGPTEADVSSLHSIEQRSWENLQQENTYWQDMLTSTYMSRSYQMVNTFSDVPVSLTTALPGAGLNNTPKSCLLLQSDPATPPYMDVSHPYHVKYHAAASA